MPSSRHVQYIGLEEFVFKLYCPRMTFTKLSKLRWHLFKITQAEAGELPATAATLKYHILRGRYQALLWSCDADSEMLSQLEHGWKIDNDCFILVISDQPPAPEAITELVKCGCGVRKCGSLSCSYRKNQKE